MRPCIIAEANARVKSAVAEWRTRGKKSAGWNGARKGKIKGLAIQETSMPMKPDYDDARLILELYELRREPEMRKARQWWLTTFWPRDVDEYMKVAMAAGTPENNWLRQVLSYWGIVAMFVNNGILSEKLFLDPSFSGELYFILAKLKPILKELRERTKNPDMLVNVEKSVLGSKAGREIFAKMEPRIQAMRPK
jgi:hypothetical protein